MQQPLAEVSQTSACGLPTLLRRVLNVELRKDDSGAFRGSVFVTFADPSSAASAVANPPLQLGSSSERLQASAVPSTCQLPLRGVGWAACCRLKSGQRFGMQRMICPVLMRFSLLTR